MHSASSSPVRLPLLALLLAASLTSSLSAETVWLSSLDLTKIKQGSGQVKIDRSSEQKPLSIAGRTFERGVGTRVKSTLWIDLGGETERFIAAVGVDDDVTGSATGTTHNFKVLGDGKTLWQSGPMNYRDPAKQVDLPVKGIQTLVLIVANAGSSNSRVQVDWADARFVVAGRHPRTTHPPAEAAVLLTPKPGLAPKINGPKVYGCGPDHPFLYRIPATGERPMQFSAENLPAGLTLDSATGIITGVLSRQGEHLVTLRAQNRHGQAARTFKIVCGGQLALTPPMGWNDWYAHYGRITDGMMREAADILVSSGLADAGYQYVNIDDCWMNAEKNQDPGRVGPARDAAGNILSNRYFPDMKALVDYIHAKGLKAGIYSSPGPTTCAGFTGSYRHEAQDAQQFADWGFDFVKYDWCSYGRVPGVNKQSLEDLKKPYRLMGDLLKRQKRDIVYNLCQYGMGAVWEWGAEVGGHSWRTAIDLGYGLDGIFDVARQNTDYAAWQKPGNWNDPDYIQIGHIGYVSKGGGLPEPSPFTPTEQYSFMSLWSLLASPIFYSGDLRKLDEFTLNVLCNPEVIDVNQDPLGRCARLIPLADDAFLLVKDLEDGSRALGLCNPGEWPAELTARWSELGMSGPQAVRDVWRQTDLGVFAGEFKVRVPRHGVVLVKVRPESN